MSRATQLQDLVDEIKVELEKFYEKDNQAAGTRARKGLQEMKKISQDIRVEIQKIKNER